MGICGSKPQVKEEAANPFYPAEVKAQVKEVSQPKPNVILDNPYPELEGKELTLHYELGHELGRGEFGITCLVVNKSTGEKLACKTISKRKLRSRIDIEDVRREVAILHHLPAHSNIVGLRGVYEDKLAVHLIQELCEGGELFERIISRGHYSERAAAQVTKTIVEIVQTCHKYGVMHRDLKPENFLFSNEDEDSALRAIDFGLSVMFSPGERFKEIVGSPYYMAPEVLRRNYGPEADVWSSGVILYILICGVPPFWAESEQGVAQQVLKGQLDFHRDPWPKIATPVKDLVRSMLHLDPTKRFTASQVLEHEWIKDANQAPDTPLGTEVLTRLRNFETMNQLKKKALRVIAENLSSEDVVGIEEMFYMMDADGSGTISLEELRVGLKKIGSNLNYQEVEDLLKAADLDKDGTIDYSEFVAATMQIQRASNDSNLRAAFDFFDKDHSGFIDIDELVEAVGGGGRNGGEHVDIQAIIKEVDKNNDGQIDFEEFAAMMRKGSEKSNGAMMSKSQEGEKNGNEGSSQQHGRGGGGNG